MDDEIFCSGRFECINGSNKTFNRFIMIIIETSDMTKRLAIAISKHLHLQISSQIPLKYSHIPALLDLFGLHILSDINNVAPYNE